MNYNNGMAGLRPIPAVIGGKHGLEGGGEDSDRRINKQVDYLKSNKHYVVSHFILECGKKLEAKCMTIATAASLFHKFFSATSIDKYDPYLIASTCLYLAGKTEDDHLKLRDVINVVHSTLHRSLEPLPLGDEYWNLRDAMVQAELLILRMVQFQVKFSHPHKYLLHYLKSLRDWISLETWNRFPIARTAWCILLDLYHDPHVLETDPGITALGTIQLTLETFGLQVPGMGGVESDRAWFKVLYRKATKERLWEVMTRIIDVYNKEADLLDPLCTTTPVIIDS